MALLSLDLFGSICGTNKIDTTSDVDRSCGCMSTCVAAHENVQIIPEQTGLALQFARYAYTAWILRLPSDSTKAFRVLMYAS